MTFSSLYPVDTFIIARLFNGLKNQPVSFGSVFCVRSSWHPYYNTDWKAMDFFWCAVFRVPHGGFSLSPSRRYYYITHQKIWIFWRCGGRKNRRKSRCFQVFLWVIFLDTDCKMNTHPSTNHHQPIPNLHHNPNQLFHNQIPQQNPTQFPLFHISFHSSKTNRTQKVNSIPVTVFKKVNYIHLYINHICLIQTHFPI